ncbi:MAG: TetR/AcrR family transcriptional regulator [Candidatus Dormibacteria bacterium]
MPDRPYRQTRRAQTTARTRERIIDSAHGLLVSGRAFTIDAAAREAGVTRMTVYAHFQNRDQLREAVLDRLAESGGMQRIPSVFAEPDPVQAIALLVDIFVGFYTRHRSALRRLHAFAALSSPQRARITPRDERRRQLLTALCTRWAQPAVPTGFDVKQAVCLLHSLTSFEFFDQLATACGRDAASSHIAKLVMAALQPPTSAA